MKVLDAAGRGAALAAARIAGRAVPFHVVLYVTTRCNLACVYCDLPERDDGELSADEIVAILDELAELGTRRVSFFGGEPLLRADLAALVAHARGLGLSCNLTTNGTLVPRRRAVVEQLDTLIVSLDGDRAAHDGNRGRGSFDEARAAIAAARVWGVPVKLNAVVTAGSLDAVDWLLDFAADQRVPITINPVRSDEAGSWGEAAAHRAPDEDLQALMARLADAKRDHPWLVFSRATYDYASRWPDFTRDRLTGAEAARAPGGPPCSAGRFHCVIYADGRLYPCTTTVKAYRALDVREAGVAAALRAAGGHDCATCFNPCMVETNALFAMRPSTVANLARQYVGRGLA